MPWTRDPSFAELVQTHRQAWLRLAVLVCGNRSDAEDAVQDALISVAAVWPRINPRGAPAYVRRTIVRKGIDIGRKKRELVSEELPDQVVGSDLLRHQQDQDFFDLLASLPPNQRAALVCRYYLDMPDDEAGRALGCARETVRSHIYRGLERLRDNDAPSPTRRSIR